MFYPLVRKCFDWSTNAGYRVKIANVIVYLDAMLKYYRNAAGFCGLEIKKLTDRRRYYTRLRYVQRATITDNNRKIVKLKKCALKKSPLLSVRRTRSIYICDDYDDDDIRTGLVRGMIDAQVVHRRKQSREQ